MIRYRLKTPEGDVHVLLRAAKKDELAALELEGAPQAVLLVKDWIGRALDDRGHALGDKTTPHRLRWAMRDHRARLHRAELVDDDIAW